MSKPLMLLSLPSSGTDWLASLIAKLPSISYYHKEFFNPITNNEHYWLLSTHFGCEAASCIHNIARKAPDEVLDMVTERLLNLGYNFTKENFLFWNVPSLARRYRIFFLHKHAKNTFPPTRVRVYSWYDAIAQSIEGNIGHKFTRSSLHERAIAVHDYCWEVAKANSIRYGLPILSYELLTLEPENVVEAHLSYIFAGNDLQLLTQMVMETRAAKVSREDIVPA